MRYYASRPEYKDLFEDMAFDFERNNEIIDHLLDLNLREKCGDGF